MLTANNCYKGSRLQIFLVQKPPRSYKSGNLCSTAHYIYNHLSGLSLIQLIFLLFDPPSVPPECSAVKINVSEHGVTGKLSDDCEEGNYAANV